MLIMGRSGSGKSVVAKGLLERMVDQQYSFCVVDPEGDYVGLPFAVTLGTQEQAVPVDAAMQALDARNNAVLNLLGMALEDRPAFLAALMPRLVQSRARTGQPHWLVIDEAHDMLAAGKRSSRQMIGAGLERAVLLTVHPDLIAREAHAEGELPEDRCFYTCASATTPPGSNAASRTRHWPRQPATSKPQRSPMRRRHGPRCAGRSSSSTRRRSEPRRARASPRRHSCTRRDSPARALLRG